ncbi:TPA: dUTP diphosphatase [Candidatus Saccharibacteria bacterium]|nr:dUTP diphosphatase [Candidatus Saccharibacteria bacterium]HRK40631.1 dUTP diphosphatase [Candidatus Saccharibacteria bacterium]
MNVAIKRLSDHAILPSYQTEGSAAADISACIDEPVTLLPGERRVIPAGFALMLPPGYEAQMRARSGLSAKYGIGLANGVGTIDSDYRGEVGAILINFGQEPFVVEPGMRVAQMVITRYEQATWQEVDQLDTTVRGEGGYGSTGH